jgi:type II secretory pathway component PulF
MTSEELVTLNDQIASMARAGLPLDQGLHALARDMAAGRLRRVTMALANDLQAGATLAQALEARRNEVPPYYGALMTAGVRSGRIADVLATLTAYARSIVHLRTILVEAAFYPGVILLYGFTIFSALILFVVPQFEQIYRDFNMKLPALTELVLWLAQETWGFIVVVPLVGLLTLLLLRFAFGLDERGRRAWARWVYAVPIVGTMIRSARLAAFADLLAILVENETPLPEAFRLAGQACSDPITAAEAQQAAKELETGLALGDVLRHRGLAPEWVGWMLGHGERAGNLPASLRQIASLYRRAVEIRAHFLRTSLPPFLILLLAVVFMTTFVIAIMLPIFQLFRAL